MPTAAELNGSLERHVARLVSVVQSGDAALAVGSLRQSDVNHLYESTFLAAVARFESFLEDLFYSALLDESDQRNITSAVRFPSRRKAEEVLLSAARAPYLVWLPFPDNALKRAEAYLVGGRPFSRLRSRGADLQLLKTIQVVRNAIAHDSGTAASRFRDLVRHHNLPPARRNPGGYLRLAVNATTMHTTLVNEMIRLARALASPAMPAAHRLLRAEDEVNSTQKVPRGTYECVICTHRIQQTSSTQTMGVCPACPQVACPQCGAVGPCAGCGAPTRSRYRRTR